MHKLTIDKVEYEVDEAVGNLIILISKERDKLRDKTKMKLITKILYYILIWPLLWIASKLGLYRGPQ